MKLDNLTKPYIFNNFKANKSKAYQRDGKEYYAEVD